MAITLSIIVPAYNAVKYLEACVDSILQSTFQDFEVLLVDDGSKDGTGALCDQLAEKYSKITVFHTENRGLSMARNLGMDYAEGTWIAFVDADDLVSPQMYESLVKQAAEDIQLVCCRFTRCPREDIAPVKHSGTVFSRTGSQIAEPILCEGYASNVWNKIYRRDILDKHAIRFKPGLLIEDQYFIADFLRVCSKAAFIDEALYYYIDTPGSIMNAFRANRIVPEKYLALPRAHAYTAQALKETGCSIYQLSQAKATMFYQTVLRKLERPETTIIQEAVTYVKQHKNTLLRYRWGTKYYLSALVLCAGYPLWAKFFRRGID